MNDVQHQVVWDSTGESEIVVGSRVVWEEADGRRFGVVTAISEWDADYDDNVGCGVLYSPRITVERDSDGKPQSAYTFEASTTEIHGRRGERAEMAFECDELEVTGS